MFSPLFSRSGTYLKYKIIDFQHGKYDYDTLFIEVDKNNIAQVPISKKAQPTSNLIGKFINVENLYKVPLDKIVLDNMK